MVYNMLVAFRFYVSFISFLGFVHAKIRIILYKKELLYRKNRDFRFCTAVLSKMEITEKNDCCKNCNCHLMSWEKATCRKFRQVHSIVS